MHSLITQSNVDKSNWGIIIVWTVFTETEISPFWRNFRHWLHRKLSFWQLSMQSVTEISSKWWHFPSQCSPEVSCRTLSTPHEYYSRHLHVIFVFVCLPYFSRRQLCVCLEMCNIYTLHSTGSDVIAYPEQVWWQRAGRFLGLCS